MFEIPLRLAISNFFWPCDEKREIGIPCDNWNDGRKTQLGKITRSDVGWTKKVINV